MKRSHAALWVGLLVGVAFLGAQEPVFYEDFDEGLGVHGWWIGFESSRGAEGQALIDESSVLSGPNSLRIEIYKGGSDDWHVQALCKVNLEQGKTYDLTFRAIADVEINVAVVFSQQVNPWSTYIRFPHKIGGAQDRFGPFTWKCNRPDGGFDLKWTLGRYDNVTVWIDSIVIAEHVDTGCCREGIEATVPDACVLYPNYPNPFNPLTTIPYALATRGILRLSIYDLQGRLIRILEEGEKTPGHYAVTWDGTDGSGKAMTSGVYLCRLDFHGERPFSQTRKLFLVR